MKTSKLKVLGFDLDDVLLNFNDALCIYHNSMFGTTYGRSDVTVNEIEKIWGCTPEEATKRIVSFYESPGHLNAEPVQGSIIGIEKLRLNNDLYIITSKPENLRQITIDWLEKYFPNTFKEIYFTSKVRGDKNKRSKGEICKEIGIELFIDDSIENANSIVSTGIPVLIYDTPWNQGELNANIRIVYSWEEIITYVNNLQQ